MLNIYNELMKKALINWKNYLYAFIATFVVALIAIVPRIINIYGGYESFWPAEWIGNIFLFSGIIFLAVGFVWQDIYKARHRKKTKNWNDKLPGEISNKAWKIFAPFLIAFALCIILGSIFSIPEVYKTIF